MDPLATLSSLRLVPVVVIDDAEQAVPLAEALAAGGLPAIEITLRTPAGLEAIRRVARRGGLAVGAGTVLDPDQARAAVDAGASFVVSPGLAPRVVEWCLAQRVACVPGVCTPTEAMRGQEYGLGLLKFFPAGSYGGAKTLKALAAVLPALRWMPTGGVDAANLREYLALPQVAACGGSWMCPAEAIRAGDWARITALTAEARKLV